MGERWNPFFFFRPCQGSCCDKGPNPGLAPGAIYLTALRACQCAIAPAGMCVTLRSALKARGRVAQDEGCEASEGLGYRPIDL